MTEADFIDPGETGLMWMKGWHCEKCGYEHNPLHRHNYYLRQGAFKVVSMIAPDGDEESVPLGWEAYTGHSYA
jgi:hypothetical protein